MCGEECCDGKDRMLINRAARLRNGALIAIVLALQPAATAAREGPSGLPVPRYVSVKAQPANARQGPSYGHPVLWQYMHAGLPLRITAESDHWRRVEDFEGATTWMHVSMLSSTRTVLVMDARLAVRAQPNDLAPPRFWAKRGVVLELAGCRGGWRKVRARNRIGWAPAGALWGAGGCTAAGASTKTS